MKFYGHNINGKYELTEYRKGVKVFTKKPYRKFDFLKDRIKSIINEIGVNRYGSFCKYG